MTLIKVSDIYMLVKLQPLKFFRNKVHKGLVRKYEGPFPILLGSESRVVVDQGRGDLWTVHL